MSRTKSHSHGSRAQKASKKYENYGSHGSRSQKASKNYEKNLQTPASAAKPALTNAAANPESGPKKTPKQPKFIPPQNASASKSFVSDTNANPKVQAATCSQSKPQNSTTAPLENLESKIAEAAVEHGKISAEDIKKKFAIPKEPFRLAVQDFLNDIAGKKLQLTIRPNASDAFRKALEEMIAKELIDFAGDEFVQFTVEGKEA